MSGEERWAVVEDVARLRDGLGVPVPPGVPDVFTEPVEDPLGDLVGRYARTHGRSPPPKWPSGSASASRCATRRWPD